MRVIHKWALQEVERQWIATTLLPKPLCVQNQNGIPTLWMEVNEENPAVKAEVFCIGAWKRFPEMSGAVYGGTTQNGQFVWHWYVRA